MRIKLIYRNYKPLHKIYQPLVSNPPEGVEYIVPSVNRHLGRLFKTYKMIGNIPFADRLLPIAERIFFLRSNDKTDIDIYHYVNMTDSIIPNKPYVVDLEHAITLVSFSDDKSRIKETKDFLMHPNCKSINCLSNAAERSLKIMFGDEYRAVNHKVRIIYPALEALNTSENLADYKYMSQSKNIIKLLFVGNLAYLKGIEELLYAIRELSNEMSSKIELHVISNDASEAIGKYGLDNVTLHYPSFSSEEILKYFFLPADLFIFPTKWDTFGMAVLDSLASGTPVIATKQFAVPELVDECRDGILIDLDNPLLDNLIMPTKKYVDSVTKPNLNIETAKALEQILIKIVNGKIDLDKMGNYGKAKFGPGGKFSIKERNKLLLKVYKMALIK